MEYLLPALIFGALLVGLAAALTAAEKLLVNYGICKIDVNAGDRELEVDGGQTLLSALNESKIFIPSACGGRGSCGYCKVTVLSGGGPVLPTETPFLTRAEVRSGMRLACQVKVREDVEIKIPEDLLNVKLFTAEVASLKKLTHDMVEATFALQDPAEISQRAGQYIQLQAPSPEGIVSRAYSISSPPSDTQSVQIVVRLVPDGIGSTYVHNLSAGSSSGAARPAMCSTSRSSKSSRRSTRTSRSSTRSRSRGREVTGVERPASFTCRWTGTSRPRTSSARRSCVARRP